MKKKTVFIIIVAAAIILMMFTKCVGRKFEDFAGVKPAKIENDSWLRISPQGYVPEYSEIEPLAMFGKRREPQSIQSMILKIQAAKNDKRISGILLEPSSVQISLPAITELGLALDSFKESGKPVIAYGDFIQHSDYLLSVYADEIYMDPSASAGLLISGVSASFTFYKELFQKLGMKMHVIQAGEFKGAGEPYDQTSLSQGTKENIDAALKDRFDQIVNHVANRRDLTTDDVLAVYNQREDFFLKASVAKEMKLIDHDKSRKELFSTKLIDAERVVKMSDYAAESKVGKLDRIALVYLEGEISPAGGRGQGGISVAKVKKIAEDLRKDKQVKAVVVRVNSPGGSALESEYIYRELKELAEEMPLIISMGGSAASGGYYISCASDYIIADEGCLTGSIGVIMLLPEFAQAARKIGLRSQTIKYGKYAGNLSILEPHSQELISSLKRNSVLTYDEFKSRVMEARNIDYNAINSIAEGRIFGAKDALALNLIDEVGGMAEALEKAAELAEISNYEVRYFPKKYSFFESLKDGDFFGLNIDDFMDLAKWDKEEMLLKKLEEIKPYQWQYLCPVVVE
ncbi:MAG TPA: signal peptide peptidase SppA [Candidatus Cloacimonetes bacterium]|nr:signal peptide peptidase SppA [Candidatus Cloacimonadota bacterium]